MLHARLALSGFVLSTLACTASQEPAPAAPPAQEQAAATPAPAATPAAPEEPAAARPAGELVFRAQPGWVSEPTTSSMRKAQFRLPGVDGAVDATLVVYWFGPQGGGGKEANIERWVGQFEQPDGSDSHAALKSTTRSVAGLEVVDVDLGGTYVAETSPGSGVRVREEGWRLLASIVTAPEGAYYLKLVGPATTVAGHAEAYTRFVAAACGAH